MALSPQLKITWGKAYGEVYCHHASLIVPHEELSLFDPHTIKVSLTIRTNEIKQKQIVGYSDNKIINHLPFNKKEGGLECPLNSTPIIDGLCLNSWTTLKNGKRGIIKVFPISLSYQIGEEEEKIFSFVESNLRTPYIVSESKFTNMKDGDQVEITLNMD